MIRKNVKAGEIAKHFAISRSYVYQQRDLALRIERQIYTVTKDKFNGCVRMNSPVLTSYSYVPVRWIGHFIEGPGLENPTYIKSIDSDQDITCIQLSRVATATVTEGEYTIRAWKESRSGTFDPFTSESVEIAKETAQAMSAVFDEFSKSTWHEKAAGRYRTHLEREWNPDGTKKHGGVFNRKMTGQRFGPFDVDTADSHRDRTSCPRCGGTVGRGLTTVPGVYSSDEGTCSEAPGSVMETDRCVNCGFARF